MSQFIGLLRQEHSVPKWFDSLLMRDRTLSVKAHSSSNIQSMLGKLLQEELQKRKVKNPSFSLRAFAKQLRMSPSAVSEILNGKRNVSRQIITRVIDRLSLDPAVSAELMRHAPDPSLRSQRKQSNVIQFFQLDLDQFHIVSDWFYFAILSLAETDEFNDSPQWIARRLAITVTQARSALKRLERLGYLRRDQDGKLEVSGKQFTSADGIPSSSIRKNHQQFLELASHSLHQDETWQRDLTGITMAIDPARIPEATRMIREFRNKLCLFLESGNRKTAVYRWNSQLFPLTKENLK